MFIEILLHIQTNNSFHIKQAELLLAEISHRNK